MLRTLLEQKAFRIELICFSEPKDMLFPQAKHASQKWEIINRLQRSLEMWCPKASALCLKNLTFLEDLSKMVKNLDLKT